MISIFVGSNKINGIKENLYVACNWPEDRAGVQEGIKFGDLEVVMRMIIEEELNRCGKL